MTYLNIALKQNLNLKGENVGKKYSKKLVPLEVGIQFLNFLTVAVSLREYQYLYVNVTLNDLSNRYNQINL